MAGKDPVFHAWKPMEDLPVTWPTLASPRLRSLAEQWNARRPVIEQLDTWRPFLLQWLRECSIETGIIEGIYFISDGITLQLVEHGLEANLIPHAETNRHPEEVAAILDDHFHTLEGLFDFVAQRRELTASYVREMHAALCRHQDEVVGRDSAGNLVRSKLLKGEWRRHANNPLRADGSIHQYTPPEHVASEMDRLIAMHHEHIARGIPPEIEAAWLHHRFTQIHPFQDGNGRVARMLSSLALIRAGLFPFSVKRTQRKSYISALEVADAGDLAPLASMIADVEVAVLEGALALS